MIEETIVSIPPAVPMEEVPQSLGPAQPALPWDEIQLAATGSNVGAAVALVFCAVALAALIIPLSQALRSWQSHNNKEATR